MKRGILISVIIVCFVILMLVFSVPVITQATEAGMEVNRFRIKTATGDIALWGEDYTLDDGDSYNYNDGSATPFRVSSGAGSVPASISCNGTIYIQIDALSKIFDKYILFNGDTSTITLLDFDPNNYSSHEVSLRQAFIMDSTEVIDSNGFLWEYNVLNTYSGSESFMVVVDEARGFSYAYKLVDENSYEFTGDGVYITKYGDISATQTVCRPVPATAQIGDFNRIRIIVDNEIIIEHGENYILADGSSVPVSIRYGDTVYFQADAFCQIFGKTILWNGDSSTVTFLDFDPSDWRSNTVLDSVDMTDANGNVWEYSVLEHSEGGTNTYFMIIVDAARGFSRAYRLAGKSAYEFTDDRVYLAKLELRKFITPSRLPGRGADSTLKFSTIIYENTPNSQDGDEWVHHFTGHLQMVITSLEVLIDNGMSYYKITTSNRNILYYDLYALDFKTGERTFISKADDYLLSSNIGSDFNYIGTPFFGFGGFEKAEDGYLYFGLRAFVYKPNTQIYENLEWITGEFKVKTDGTEDPIYLGFKATTNPYE